MLSCTQLLIAASSLLSLTIALPQHTSLTPTQPPQTPNCGIASSEDSYSSPCWNQLDIADYLTAWSKKTPTCVPRNPVNFACCQASEPWSLCFLRISTGVGGYDCTKLGSPSCNYVVEIGRNTPSSVAPQMSYVLRNILAVNAMFTAYYGGQAEGGQSINDGSRLCIAGFVLIRSFSYTKRSTSCRNHHGRNSRQPRFQWQDSFERGQRNKRSERWSTILRSKHPIPTPSLSLY